MVAGTGHTPYIQSMSGVSEDILKEIGLTEPEITLWRALEAKQDCIFAGERQSLRADIVGKLLRQEAIDGQTPPPLPRQVGIENAKIVGVLDMSDTNTNISLKLLNCEFPKCPDFSRSSFAFLDFEASTFNQGGIFQDLSTQSHLWLDKIKTDGVINIVRANIGGQLAADKATFTNPSGQAIWAQGAYIKDSVFLMDATITGEAVFTRCKIGGQFNARKAKFTNPNGTAIWAQGAQIRNGVFLLEATITGEADFNNCKIDYQLSAKKATFTNPNGKAIWAQGAEIKGGVFLRDAIISGVTNFSSCKIGVVFDARNTTFTHPNGIAIRADGAEIEGEIWLTEFPHPPIGIVDFSNAALGHVITDDNSYPLGILSLDGTMYNNLTNRFGQPWTQSDGWLKANSNINRGELCKLALTSYIADQNEGASDSVIFENVLAETERLAKFDREYIRTPFAYRQFARVLDRNGHEREARNIRIAAGEAYTDRTAKTFSPWRRHLYRIWRWTLKHLIGYGVKPWRILPALLILWAGSTALFWGYYDSFTPSREKVYLAQCDEIKETDLIDIASCKTLSPDDPLPAGYPHFSPPTYALDVMLPVVDFAQESHWRPKNDVRMAQLPAGSSMEKAIGRWWHNLNWLRIFNRFVLALGWAFSTIAVLGFTGVISDKREE